MQLVDSLVDSFGRSATDLRISLTDKCNFRCRYCMPPEGLPWLDDARLLTYEEITRLARIFVGLGVSSMKLTGGEPLVRRDVHLLVGMLRGLGKDLDISMTTNGYLLASAAPKLASAGLDRVTVSCDSLIKHRFAEMTLRDALEEVLKGIRVAAQSGLTPLKINTVVVDGVNDDETVELARLARATGYEIRFIEYMPLDAQNEWKPEAVVPAGEILDSISETFPLQPVTGGREAAQCFRFADGAPGRIGLISSVTEPFCDSCNRLRLTADGQLRSCLFSNEETDLRGPLRGGAADAEIARLARDCVARKWAGHVIGQDTFVQPFRSMSQIGG